MNILDLIFPKKCINCGQGEGYICENCLSKVKLASQTCPICDKLSIDGMVHFKCKTKFGLDGHIAVWEYEGVVRKAILALKYKFATEVSKEILEAFKKAFDKNKFNYKNFILIPIPVHFLRQNWRGFNQSEILGKEIAQELKMKFVSDFLSKNRSTVSQTELKGEDRAKNIKDVFLVKHKSDSKIYPNILLFDDVWTTGSTVKEACKVLKRSGVKKVWSLTLAK